MIRHRSIAIPLAAALASLALAATAGAGRITSTTISDQFGGQGIDQSVWWYGTNDPNVSIDQGRGRVTVHVGAGASDSFNASVGSRCRLHGDFDAQLSYRLVDWPGNDSIDVSLMASDLGGVNVYASDDFGGGYGAYFPPSGGGFVQGPVSTTGSLRLVRRGDTFTGYESDKQQGGWVQVATGSGSTADTGISLAVFNVPFAAPFGGLPATIEFTSLTAEADGIAC
jgi:hypothetical protein